MKKKILYLILTIIMLPSIMVFTACKEDNSYNLNKLVNDYLAVGENLEYIKVSKNLSNVFDITFDYSESTTLYNAVEEESSMYYNLDNFYVSTFNYTIEFTNNYIGICANNDKVDNDELKNNIKSDIDQLSSALVTLDSSLSDLISYTNYYGESQDTDINDSSECLNRLYKVFDCFDSVYKYSAELSVNLASVYYGYILNDPNPDFTSIDINSFDATEAVSAMKNRIAYLSSNLARNFVERNVILADSSWAFRNGETEELLKAFNEFKENIVNINRDTSSFVGDAINNDSEKKSEFLNLSQQMYGVQLVLDNDRQLYDSAYKSVDYVVVNSMLNNSAYELECVKIINNHSTILNSYCTVVNNMIDLILNK